MAQVQRLPRHQDNRLLAALANEDLAALELHLAFLELQRGQVLYEPGETVTRTYFPHDAMVSLVTVMSDGKSAEMAVFGCEGLFGLGERLCDPPSLRALHRPTGWLGIAD